MTYLKCVAALALAAYTGYAIALPSSRQGTVEVDSPKLTATVFESKQGRALLNKAAKWTGIDRLAKNGAIILTQDLRLRQSRRMVKVKRTIKVFATGDYHESTTYDGVGTANKIVNGTALAIDAKGIAQKHAPAQKRALERQRARNLAYVLLNRDAKGLTCKSEGVADGIASVVVNIDGSTSTLWIEEKTGKVVSHAIRGKNQARILGDVQLDFTEYGKSGGITLPIAWTATYNGQDSPMHLQNRMRLEVVNR